MVSAVRSGAAFCTFVLICDKMADGGDDSWDIVLLYNNI